MDNAITRDEFRERVLERDSFCCVICGVPAHSAHHIIDRSLFANGGYEINNGASLCEKHHLEAERTILSCDAIREKAKIQEIVLPEHFFPDFKYDKWGNVILPNGNLLKGELFFEDNVQKALAAGNKLDLFQKYIKYQRTYHLPWSNLKKDDRILESDEHFRGKRVIGSLKMDGEATSMYNDYLHARSIDSKNNISRNWVKGLWGNIAHLLDDNMRVCGENLYAVHSIKYTELPSYFMVYSIWIDNRCLSWDETLEYAQILSLETVPVFFDGIYDKDKIIAAFEPYRLKNEGYVIRVADEFKFIDFRRSIAKYVRPEFRQAVDESDVHWSLKKVEANGLC